MNNIIKKTSKIIPLAFIFLATPMMAQELYQVPEQAMQNGFQLTPNLVFPAFNAEKGRNVFATKGCPVCHEVNGIGGTDAPSLAFGKYDSPVNAMLFAADLWEKSDAMGAMQLAELGAKIELSADDLAAIIAFLASPEEQVKFSTSDIPAKFLEKIKAD